MANALKSKICWHCDGDLSLEQDRCTYCGTLQEQVPIDRVVPIPLPEPIHQEQPKSFLDSLTQSHLQLALLISTMMGATLLLFTICLLCFSTNGVFTLSWNAGWWPVVGLLAAGMLYISYISNKKLE